jgi:hypothetical protein
MSLVRVVYRGNVATRRGAEVRPGSHEPILSEQEFREAVGGVEGRKHATGKRPPTAKRLYLLRGLVYCACGTRMHGDAVVSRGDVWRYYLCPVAEGSAPSGAQTGSWSSATPSACRPTLRSVIVVSRLRELMWPDEAITAARAQVAAMLPVAAARDG